MSVDRLSILIIVMLVLRVLYRGFGELAAERASRWESVSQGIRRIKISAHGFGRVRRPRMGPWRRPETGIVFRVTRVVRVQLKINHAHIGFPAESVRPSPVRISRGSPRAAADLVFISSRRAGSSGRPEARIVMRVVRVGRL